jgi:hypothetical protein
VAPPVALQVTSIKTKFNTKSVKQKYPKVVRKQEIKFLYRDLKDKDAKPVPIYTGRPGAWATVKLSGTMSVVDVWQFADEDSEMRPAVIRRDTDLVKSPD